MSPLPVAGESPALSASCVTIGNFDGVHLGHQSLIRLAMAAAARDGLEFILLTFDPHPREVLFGKEKHFPLATREEKKRLLAALGIKKILEIPFTRELASLSAEEFIASRLVPLNTRRLVAGHDFSLGKNREGGRARLEELGEKYGYKVSQAPALKIDGEIVSSTLLRDLIKRGDMARATALLGRYYRLSGTVGHGFARGGTLGFPTANLEGAITLYPGRGVYATFASWDDVRVPAVTNIGTNPTFSGDRTTIETFFLDSSADVYGKPLSIDFVRRIRSERRFSGADELKTQIAQDVGEATKILAEVSPPA